MKPELLEEMPAFENGVTSVGTNGTNNSHTTSTEDEENNITNTNNAEQSDESNLETVTAPPPPAATEQIDPLVVAEEEVKPQKPANGKFETFLKVSNMEKY
jgi:hypothetical protein